jgi:hypothetical protein
MMPWGSPGLANVSTVVGPCESAHNLPAPDGEPG